MGLTLVEDPKPDSLYSYVCGEDEEADGPTAFVDATSRCLRDGRFLLLIVGDGIREGVTEIADFLQQSPTLQYTLGLVELACYQDPTQPESLLYVPQVVTRSREVTRAVVQIGLKGLDERQVEVTADVPSEQSGHTPRRENRLSEDEFYRLLTASTSADTADQLRHFVDTLLTGHGSLVGHFTPLKMVVSLQAVRSGEKGNRIVQGHG